MSDRPIQVGDLVVIVKSCPHCGNATDLGIIFEVRGLFMSDGRMNCCGNVDNEMTAEDHIPDGGGTPVSVIKRIPPLSELEGQRTEENIKEPA